MPSAPPLKTGLTTHSSRRERGAGRFERVAGEHDRPERVDRHQLVGLAIALGQRDDLVSSVVLRWDAHLAHVIGKRRRLLQL